MELEERVASAIKAEAETARLTAPDPASIRRSARRRAHRRAALTAGAALATAVVAVPTVMGGLGRQERPGPPVDRPDSTNGQTVVSIPGVRDTQVVVRPSVRSTATPGKRRVASASTDDAEYDGTGQISVPVDPGGETPAETFRWEVSCNGAPRARYVVVVEPDLQLLSGRCGAAHTSGEYSRDTQGWSDGWALPVTLRMSTTGEDLHEFRRCFDFSPPQGYDDVEPRRLEGSQAVMRATVHVDEPGPVAVSMFGESIHARAIANGYVHSLTTAAAAATGAGELTFAVEPSQRERAAQAMAHPVTRRWGACVRTAAPGESERCHPTVQLLVDGEPVEDQMEGPFGGTAGWGRLAPGGRHLITLRVVEGDPRNVDLGVLVYERD